MEFPMDKVINSQTPSRTLEDWKQLFEAALAEEDPHLFPERLQTAKDAIVDEIEDSFGTASSSDRLLLLAALNTVSGLFEANSQRQRISRSLGPSA
jgi:hypothetical protein